MRVLLLGLGRANLWVARYLICKGEEVYLFEENPDLLSKDALAIIKEGKLRNYSDMSYDLAIASPGFPPHKEIIQSLKRRGVKIVDEIEWTYNTLKPQMVIAITGTNGKSTTAGLISQILSQGGMKNFLGGNIAPGKPFSQALFEEEYDYYILEVSSFQLTRIEKFHPQISVLTNISKDHLNWHKDFEEYITAKRRIFINQSENDYAVLNFEDETTKELRQTIRSRIIFFGHNAQDGARLDGYFHFYNDVLFENKGIPLFGVHNEMNILAAISVAKILNIQNAHIEKSLKTFKPLPHRLEDLGVIGGIRYINNSMCTNEASAIASFKAVKGNKIVILGGKKKGDEGKGYIELLAKEAKACILLGENAKEIAQIFEKLNYKQYRIASDMKSAVKNARGFAQEGDVIILNPGYASFGNFRDFQERGEAFKNAIKD